MEDKALFYCEEYEELLLKDPIQEGNITELFQDQNLLNDFPSLPWEMDVTETFKRSLVGVAPKEKDVDELSLRAQHEHFLGLEDEELLAKSSAQADIPLTNKPSYDFENFLKTPNLEEESQDNTGSSSVKDLTCKKETNAKKESKLPEKRFSKNDDKGKFL